MIAEETGTASAQRPREIISVAPDEPPAPARSKRIGLLILLVLGVPALIFWAIHYFNGSLATVSTDDAFIDGHVVAVSPKISGQVQAVHVADNQFVKKGDLLVEIDPKDWNTKLEQKRAARATSDSNQKTVAASFALIQARVTTAETSARQIEAETAASQAAATKAEADLKRNEELRNKSIISPQEFDTIRAAADTARANLQAAREKAAGEVSKVNEAKAQLAAARTVIDMAHSQLEQASIDVKAAQTDLTYTRITAPQDGRVTRKMVEPGAYVQTGQSLLAIVPDEIWVTANFKETQLRHMRPGQPVEVDINAVHQAFPAHVESIQSGSGARFSLLPPENAVGNFVKVVQRVPVKIVFDKKIESGFAIGPGLSVEPVVKVKDQSLSLAWQLALTALLAAVLIVVLLKTVLRPSTLA